MSGVTLLHPRFAPTPPRSSLRVDFLLDKIEDSLLGGFGMRELALEAKTSVYERACSKGRVGLDARVFAGDGRLARLVVVRGASATGEVESLSLLALPRPDLGAPMLFASALLTAEVWGDLRLALASTCDRVVEVAELEAVSRDLDQSASRGARLAAQALPLEDMGPDYALAQYLDSFAALLEGAARAGADSVRAAQRSYLTSLRADRSVTAPIERAFGAGARRVFTENFFDPRVV